MLGKMILTSEESGLVFDYFFRCAEREQIDRGSVLVASNPKAAEIYSCIKETLARLEHMRDEGCPDELVDMTIARLKLAKLAKATKTVNNNNDSKRTRGQRN